jgi:transcription-repair coupling factor (superfamily II helicase)
MVLIKAPIEGGVVFVGAKLALYGNADLFETVAPSSQQRSRSRPKTASFFSDFSDLKPGDYVVHIDHGIGQFEGLRQVAVEGATGEFMLLRYAGDAKLYVPLARLDLVQKYQSLGGAQPVLDRLGTTIWEARKTRVRKSVTDMADQLLKLYAERKTAPGHAFPPDTNWTREFEDAFEFDETPDQLRAIEDVKRDMESTLPMDRLLCGDVGYGKTEVAMRAAFKAIADSKQVAVLAPTTVLAFQHFQTFKRRFSAFPVRVEMLSRFRTEKEQKKVLEEMEAGKVDILIGTHRLLSKDVKFQDLGLLVVDEEQRFGHADSTHVAHVSRRFARYECDRNASERPPGDPDYSSPVQRDADSACGGRGARAGRPGIFRSQSRGIHCHTCRARSAAGPQGANRSGSRADARDGVGKSDVEIRARRS